VLEHEHEGAIILENGGNFTSRHSATSKKAVGCRRWRPDRSWSADSFTSQVATATYAETSKKFVFLYIVSIPKTDSKYWYIGYSMPVYTSYYLLHKRVFCCIYWSYFIDQYLVQ